MRNMPRGFFQSYESNLWVFLILILSHTYCGTCLVRWIQMKKTCPLCRHKLDRNYRFDKDILATKLVGDLDVKCLRC
jgi:hypothetical protein